MIGEPRISLVDDHFVVTLALRLLIDRTLGMQFSGTATSVDGLLRTSPPADLVVLDLRLADGSSVGQNVARLRATGSQVLVLTASDNPYLLRSAARTPIVGILRKSAPPAEVVAALLRAARGDIVWTPEWASAVDSDIVLDSVRLTDREREVLGLYASGASSAHVSAQLGIARSTVESHLKRIRQQYSAHGRESGSKLDLYRRGVEDGHLPSPDHIR